MTRQEYRDEVLRRSAAGLFPSLQEDNSCAFRGLNGAACLSGVCIPDAEYRTGLEGSPPDEIFAPHWYPEGYAGEHMLAFQRLHDNLAVTVVEGRRLIRRHWDAEEFEKRFLKLWQEFENKIDSLV